MSADMYAHDAIAQFSDALRAAGLTPEAIHADGELHRFSSNGKRGDEAGWYVLHLDGGIPAGAFGDWRTGLNESWRADIGRRLTEAERAAQRELIASLRRKREADDAKRHTEAQERAQREWRDAKPADATHPYLVRKGVQAHGLRVDEAGRLLVPVRIAGELHSLQYIDAEGGKRFLPGGRVAGGYFAIGKGKEVVCIAEGYATAATIREATGYAVAAAFNCGNLEAVARTVRERLPKAKLIVCADDDATTDGNPGTTKATAAARAIGGLLAVPDFGADRLEKATDFNDLAVHRGMDAVKACIANATHPGAPARPAPLPLVAELTADPYPLDALPGEFGAAVREVVAYLQCPVALAACSALSALSVAAQGLANVRRDGNLEGPVSLYLLSAAYSGERKSELDRYFSKPLREWEAAEAERIKPDLARSRADLAAWTAEREGVQLSIKEARRKGKPTDELRDQLTRLEEGKPEPLRVPRVLLESETAESLAWNLARPDGWPSAGILSSEAGIILGGHSMRNDTIMQSLALLNKLWGGETLRVGRKTSEQFTLSGARLTMGLAVQAGTLQAFLDSSRGLARDTGFLARFLIAWPASTQGTRFYREAPSDWPGLTAYRSRLRQLLDTRSKMTDAGQLAPPSPDMTSEGFALWRDFYNEAERELAQGGELTEIRDVASKAAENCARVAALFHLFEHGSDARIEAHHVAAAVKVVTWHLFESRRLLSVMALSKPISNAAKLDEWLRAECSKRGTETVSVRDALRLGPNPTRLKSELRAALAELDDANRAWLDDDGRTIRVATALLAEG